MNVKLRQAARDLGGAVAIGVGLERSDDIRFRADTGPQSAIIVSERTEIELHPARPRQRRIIRIRTHETARI